MCIRDRNKMDGYRERHDRGELHIPLSLPEKQKREEADVYKRQG